MEILFGEFGAAIPLAIVVGITVLIVRRVSNRQTVAGEGPAVSLHRFFLYAVMLGMLILSAIGLAGLIDAAATAASRVTQDSADAARSIAFVVVGVPVYAGLAIHTARRLRDDRREQQSLGWAFYLTVALTVSLITAMTLLARFVGGMLDEREIDRTLLINSMIWTGIWAGHWVAAQRKGASVRMQVHLLVGSAAGLVAVVAGAGAALAAVLERIYDSLFAASIASAGVETIVRPLIVVMVGVSVWWWYWFRHARHSGRTSGWHAYVILLGILGSVVTLVTSAGVTLFEMLRWIIGDPALSPAAAHFDFVPAAIAAAIVSGANWVYHAAALDHGASRGRTEVHRVHDYLLSGAGLLVAAGGLVTLVAVALDSVTGREVASSESGDGIAAALTLLTIGVTLWWRYWSTIRRRRQDNLHAELRSVSRRIYLFLLFGAIGVVAVINLIIIVFFVFEDILEGTFGSATINGAAVPLALLVTAGTLAAYHFAVFRDDRGGLPDEQRPALREIILVSANGDHLAEAIRTRSGATVRVLPVAEGPSVASTVDDVLKALDTATRRQVVVVATGDHEYTVMPIDS